MTALEVTTRLVDDLLFACTDTHGRSLLADGNSESPRGFSPTQLLLAGVAACSGTDVASILRKERQDLRGMEVRTRGERLEEPPWTYTRVHVEYIVRGRAISEAAVRRAIELSVTKYCSVSTTIEGKAKVTTSYRIEEA